MKKKTARNGNSKKTYFKKRTNTTVCRPCATIPRYKPHKNCLSKQDRRKKTKGRPPASPIGNFPESCGMKIHDVNSASKDRNGEGDAITIGRGDEAPVPGCVYKRGQQPQALATLFSTVFLYLQLLFVVSCDMMASQCIPCGLLLLLLMMMGVGVSEGSGGGTSCNLTATTEFLELYEGQAERVPAHVYRRYWAFITNITAHNQKAFSEAYLQYLVWQQNTSHLADQFNTNNCTPSVQRKFAKIRNIGVAALKDKDKLKRLTQVSTSMKSIYNQATVQMGNKSLPLDPDIRALFASSRDENELRQLWVGWRNATGKKMRQLYSQFVNLSNEAMESLGYADTGAYWRSWYEMDTFEQDVARLYRELQPFYLQLHAFVRYRLKKQYGAALFPASGHIPAHLLGNVWAQDWYGVEELMMPFPNKTKLDITPHMVAKNYTALKIFETADDFFTSLGLEPMPQSFWDNSMLEKPKDGRQVACHPTAFDFGNGVDFRIKQCTEVTHKHLGVAHHEMGHIEYFLLYKHLPTVFRDGANPGFHEAVGDTIALSVDTPRHLQKIGLLPAFVQDNETELNYLMSMALQKIAFLPFGYLVDKWRWSVFRGDATPANYSQAWWDLRCDLQGIYPPVKRTEEDFDPGSKFHIPDNMPYIRYFVSYVIQFQFHKALCEAAGHQGPLHTCDIYNSTVAGDKLRAMLSKGSSEVWTVPFQALTGTTRMSAQPLIQYFQPLMDFLKKENAKNGKVGWSKGCP